MAFEITVIPWSTLLILSISIAIAFINTGLNRFLISKLVGWNEYKTMQKEMAEYRSQQMAAARANDKKQLEKLKKKESQIMNMTKKQQKPQMIMLGLSFVYIAVWIFWLTPTFGRTPVAYLPGFSGLLNNDLGQIGVTFWYPICSLFFGTLANKLFGIMSIE
jgi:uncharacterized membrane protein (DUF106 family)